MSDKIIKKNQFQIRKVPLKRFPPEKVPQLYALDIHSICLPKKDAKRLDWVSINYEGDNAEG